LVDGQGFAPDTVGMISKNILPLIWFTAFLCSPFFVNAWELGFMGAAIALISLWAVLSLSCASVKGIVVPQSWVLRIMGAFWLLAFLSILRSDVINISFMAFCFFSVMPLSFLVFATTGKSEHYKLIASLMGIVFAGMAVWALVQFFVLNEYFDGRARHPLMNPNSLAALFSLPFFCGLGLVLGAQKDCHKIGAVIFTALIFAGIMATGSRGALFAMLPMVIMLMIFAREAVIKQWKFLLILLVLCAGVFLLSEFGGREHENLINRVADTISLKEKDITNNRVALWLATIDMIKVHGLLGTGIGTYFLYFPEFRLPTDASGAYFAHSDPLQFWAELGFLGPILFYAFIFAVIGRTVIAVKSCHTLHQKILILSPFFALGACVLHTHVTFNFSNFSILLTVAFLLSVWFWATQEVSKTKTKTVSFPNTLHPAVRNTALSLPFLFIVIFFTGYILSEHYTNKARENLIAGQLEDFSHEVMLANKLSFDSNYRSYLLAVTVPMSLLEDKSGKLSPEARKEIFDQAVGYLQHVLSINPRSASAFYYLAKIQQLVVNDFVDQNLKTSQEYYREALKLDPLHIGSRIELSKMYEQQGELNRAIDLIEQGAKYRYSTAKALDLYVRQAELYLKKGDMQSAQKAIQKRANFQNYLEKSITKQNSGIWGQN